MMFFRSMLFLVPAALVVLGKRSSIDQSSSSSPSCGDFDMSETMARVVGGERAPSMWPWLVHIIIHRKPEQPPTEPVKSEDDDEDEGEGSGQSQGRLEMTKVTGCGGAIIDKYNILTAGHCLYPLDRLVRFDVHIGRYIFNTTNKVWKLKDPKKEPFPKPERLTMCSNLGVNDVRIHEQFNDTKLYDIALIRLPEPLSFVVRTDNGRQRPSKIQPICMPLENNSDYSSELGNETIDSSECYVTGWGTLCQLGPEPAVLQQGLMTIGNESYCQNNEREIQYDPELLLCAVGSETMNNPKGGGPQPCFGDSGGPFQCRIRTSESNRTGKWVLMGLVNYANEFCGAPGKPDYFARVQGYLDWIKANKKKKGDKKKKPKPKTTTEKPKKPFSVQVEEAHSLVDPQEYDELARKSIEEKQQYEREQRNKERRRKKEERRRRRERQREREREREEQERDEEPSAGSSIVITNNNNNRNLAEAEVDKRVEGQDSTTQKSTNDKL